MDLTRVCVYTCCCQRMSIKHTFPADYDIYQTGVCVTDSRPVERVKQL